MAGLLGEETATDVDVDETCKVVEETALETAELDPLIELLDVVSCAPVIAAKARVTAKDETRIADAVFNTICLGPQ